MPRTIIALALVCALASRSDAQDPAAKAAAKKAMSEAQVATQADHKKMMELLKIDKLRQGANGSNREAPNAANYDESKANPYPKLPDPLVLKDGGPVTTPEGWWGRRRPEIVEDFDREIYGRAPGETPRVRWEVTATTEEKVGDVPVVVKKLVGHVDNSSYPEVTVDIQLTLTTPSDAPGPVPVMMEFGFGAFGPRPGGAAKAAVSAKAAPPAGPTWQQQVLARGWGYAILVPSQHPGRQRRGADSRGIIGLCNKGQDRKADDWGSLRAWAWGAGSGTRLLRDRQGRQRSARSGSRGIRATARQRSSRWPTTRASRSLTSVPPVRGGPSSTAGTGARSSRTSPRRASTTGWPGNFLKYAGPQNWNDLPVDSHELVALCAPRPGLHRGGSDQWRRLVPTRRGCSWPPPAPGRCTSCLARTTSGPPSSPRSRPP